MRGIGLPISRLSTARAVLAGAAILAGAAMRPAQAGSGGQAPHSDELAMAIPRIHAPAGANGIGLPQPLAPSEAARVRRILSLQRQDSIPAAVAETARLTDQTLLGHILADRLLAHPARASAAALSDWLGRYADLPDACAIYTALLRRLPPGAARPPAPAGGALAAGHLPADSGDAQGAAAARTALQHGQDASAERLARAAFDRSRHADGQAGYVAGLAAWQRGAPGRAAGYFEAASLAPNAGAALRAAAALWAARAHLQQGDAANWRPWMLRAAAEPHTLHGMLAMRALGLKLHAAPASPELGDADIEAIGATPQGRRAFALLQVGEPARAEAELRRLWPVAQASPAVSRALFLVAGAANLVDLVADLSGTVNATEADLPVPVLQPRGGFRLDPALVYAVARVESNFEPDAASGAGARGLMQLMPVALEALGVRTPARLSEPGQNLKFGQAYLAYLGTPHIAGDDLLRVLASYNAGPNAVQRWARIGADDPLMFMELIPTDETRHFVQRILTNLWGYGARFHLAQPSLDLLSHGAWPRFASEVVH